MMESWSKPWICRCFSSFPMILSCVRCCAYLASKKRLSRCIKYFLGMLRIWQFHPLQVIHSKMFVFFIICPSYSLILLSCVIFQNAYNCQGQSGLPWDGPVGQVYWKQAHRLRATCRDNTTGSCLLRLNISVGNGACFDAHLDVGVAEKPYNRKLSPRPQRKIEDVSNFSDWLGLKQARWGCLFILMTAGGQSFFDAKEISARNCGTEATSRWRDYPAGGRRDGGQI